MRVLVTALVLTACAGGHSSAGPPPAASDTAAVTAPSAVGTIATGLEEDLRSLGYDPGQMSGLFSPSLAGALTRFQTAAGVSESERGALGPSTARALTTALPHASEAVRALQSALTDVGLFTGTIDGVYGNDLLAAVQVLQRKAGIPADGQYGPQTAAALDRLYASTPENPVTTTAPPRQTTTTVPSNQLTFGSTGPKVTALQQRLTVLGFRPGPVNGFYGADTAGAVLAFQKQQGLERDGIAGPQVLAALAAPAGAGPRGGLPVPRIEVDIARQIAFVVLPGKAVTTLNVSTGSGLHYTDPTTHATDLAYTPVGSFTVQRAVDGDVKAPLGTLHKPLYFYQGWAVHGAASVPAWPASHGCVRVSDDDADWLFPQIPVGTAVVIYDTTGKSPGPGQAPAGAAPGY